MVLTDSKKAERRLLLSKWFNKKQITLIFIFIGQIYISVVSWISTFYYFGIDSCTLYNIEIVIAPIVFGITHLFNIGYMLAIRNSLETTIKQSIIYVLKNLIISAGIFIGGFVVIPMC
jgi:hypothetical protein